MNLVPFDKNDQNELKKFLEIMYSTRGYKFDPNGLQSDIRNINKIYKKTGGEFWVLKKNDKIIGSIALKIINQKEKIGEIKRYFVLPDYQGKGLGRLLMENIINEAKIRKLLTLRLDTMKKSKIARNIFKKFGFYEIPKYNDNDIAEIFMELIL